MTNRLIESRLTPNAISLTGFALCLVAAVLVWQDHYLLGGLAFVVGSVCDTLDGRYARASGKGTPFGAFLDSTLDRIEEGIVLTAVAYVFAKDGNEIEMRELDEDLYRTTEELGIDLSRPEKGTDEEDERRRQRL